MAQADPNDTNNNDDDEKETLEEKFVAAIRKGDLDTCRSLILDGPKINDLGNYSLKTKEKITPLHIAVAKRNVDIVKLLLKFKADPNVQSFPSGNLPIHTASQWANVEIIQLLLDAGADATIANNKGKNCLQMLGNKYKDDKAFDPDIIDLKTEAQLLLLGAATSAAEQNKKEIDDDIADAVSGLSALKVESNIRIKNAQDAQGKRFDQTHPYLRVKKQRLVVWSKKNGTIKEFLKKRHINAKMPQWTDADEITHVDFSHIKQFQITLARQLLEQNGLNLEPEPKASNKNPNAKKKKKSKSPANKKK